MHIPESTLMRAGETQGRSAVRVESFRSMRQAALRDWEQSGYGLPHPHPERLEPDGRILDLSIVLGWLREARADRWLIDEINRMRDQYSLHNVQEDLFSSDEDE